MSDSDTAPTNGRSGSTGARLTRRMALTWIMRTRHVMVGVMSTAGSTLSLPAEAGRGVSVVAWAGVRARGQPPRQLQPPTPPVQSSKRCKAANAGNAYWIMHWCGSWARVYQLWRT